MIIIDRSDSSGVFGCGVESDQAPTASRDDGAVPVAKEVEALDLPGTGLQIVSWFIANLRCVRASYWLPS
jgi:hypothetical protein